MSPQLLAFFDRLHASYSTARCPAEAMEPAKQAFMRFVQDCGIEICNFGCFDLAPGGPVLSAFSGTNMSDAWIEEYMQRGMYSDDYAMRSVRALTRAEPGSVVPFGEWMVPRLPEGDQRSVPVLRGAADAGMEDAIALIGMLPLEIGGREHRYFAFGLGGDQGTGDHAMAQIAEIRIAAFALLERLRPEFEASADGVQARLTPRERDVLAFVSGGLQRDAIADWLGIALPTVDLHLANLRKKLKASTTSEAVARAFRYGLL